MAIIVLVFSRKFIRLNQLPKSIECDLLFDYSNLILLIHIYRRLFGMIEKGDMTVALF